MAITSSYPIAVPTITDTLVGTKFIENKEPTTNSFNIGDIIQLASSTIGYTPVSIGTANGLSLSGQVLSLGLSSSSTNGALSSANWTTFNNKQNALSGTGFIKASGSTISYDNTTYTPEARTLTINGTTYDLSVNRSWTVSAGVSGSGSINKIPKFTTSTTVGDSNITDNGSVVTITTEASVDGINIGKGPGSANGFSTRVGAFSLFSNTTGLGNTTTGYSALLFNTTGDHNTANGMFALKSNTLGSDNTGVGFNVSLSNTIGNKNTGIGSNTLLNIVDGSNNTAFGYGAGANAIAGSSNNVYIGYNAGPTSTVTESNKLYIANASGTALISGDFSARTVTIDGAIAATKLILPSNAPVNPTAAGVAGEIRYDSSFLYICVATNSWERVPLSAW